jgi:mono/diheme cytochrome c family protein
MDDTTSSDPSTGSLVQRSWHAVRNHPALWAIAALLVLVALGLSVYIGMDLYFTIPVLVLLGAIAIALHQLWRRRRAASGPVDGALSARMGVVAVAVAGVLTFVLIQFVPYGRAHSNPAGTGEPDWATPRTRELMVAACYSCHSNEVEYPPYASVAPISWMVQRHVDEGREAVNFSDFATDPGEADESIEVIEEGEMPPPYFTRFGLHPEAKLTDAEMAELIGGLRATPGMTEGGD